MCLTLSASGLWVRYATLQNLIPSFPCIAPGWRKGSNFAIWQLSRDIHIAFPQTASPSIVGISSKLPVKNEIKNETYAPAMYATVKRNSVKPSSSGNDEKSHRISVIGIEAPDLKVCVNKYIQWSAVTVTPSGTGKSVTITDSHSIRSFPRWSFPLC